MAPRLVLIERASGPNTRAIVVAHLFGARLDLDPVIELAHSKGLVVFEDCAQAFDGQAYKGHPESEMAMFSFGPLTTASTLGGELIRVSDAGMRGEVGGILDTATVQTAGV